MASLFLLFPKVVILILLSDPDDFVQIAISLPAVSVHSHAKIRSAPPRSEAMDNSSKTTTQQDGKQGPRRI
jgi:hypothetical protein